MDDLTRLALAAGDGDRQALARFVRASQADVWRLCAYLVDRDNADDLTQEVYLRAVPALARFRGDSTARTWLLTVTRRTCADWLRRTVRHRKLTERVRSRVLAADEVAAGPDTESTDEVNRLLAELTADRRAAFVLTQLIGLSYAEAADICDVAVGTIRSRVSRAREDLVEQLRRDQRDHG